MCFIGVTANLRALCAKPPGPLCQTSYTRHLWLTEVCVCVTQLISNRLELLAQDASKNLAWYSHAMVTLLLTNPILHGGKPFVSPCLVFVHATAQQET